ncbi:MAG: (2Fe-2S) ferredoxin domain-containing protein, partial [Candidatus Hydrogenedentales bacterium]
RKCCAEGAGEAILDRLKSLVKEQGLNSRVRVSKSGCMDRCEQGPNVMVFPSNRWYCGVTPEDAGTIVFDVAGTL